MSRRTALRGTPWRTGRRPTGQWPRELWDDAGERREAGQRVWIFTTFSVRDRACEHRLVSQGSSGIALARAYFADLIAPLLRERLPDVRYAGARVGAGSEVLGLDDATSRDHDWGLRVQLFVSDAHQARVESTLDTHLPAEFREYPVRFGVSGDPAERLRIDVTSVDAYVEERLGFDPRAAASVIDWLSLSGQAALEVVAGAVFEDQTGELTGLREALAWYPDDIWRYVVACDWQRLDQELPLLGRAGERGDDLGSRVIAARLVDIAVHLAFMLARSWPPVRQVARLCPRQPERVLCDRDRPRQGPRHRSLGRTSNSARRCPHRPGPFAEGLRAASAAVSGPTLLGSPAPSPEP